MKTYENMKYSGIEKDKKWVFFELLLLFDSKYEKETASQILKHDKMFYSQLPKNDFDSKKYECNVPISYDSFYL